MKYEESLNINMPKHWSVVKIEDVGKVVGGGTPSTKKKEYFGGDIAWITPKDLSGYNQKYISNGSRNITKLGLEQSSAKLMPKNTVLLSSRAPIGYVAIAKNEITTNQGFKSVICNEKLILPDYLYYIFKISKRRLESIASGTTFKEVSGKKVKEFQIPLPPLSEQNNIINILNKLDEKIELNNFIISNLEDLAQTLFKHWFVDFEFPNENGEPYKSNGGKMVESELGMMPEFFKIKEFSNLTDFIMGQSPKSSTYNEKFEGMPLINGASDFKKDYIKPLKYTTDPKRLSQKGDYLFGVRATVGNVTLVDKKYSLGRGVGIARPFKEIHSEFIYFMLIDGINILERSSTGSVYINITRKDLENMKVILPNNKLLTDFHNKTSPLISQKENLLKENKNLLDLRDSLIPKLLSGEVKIQ